MRALSILFIFTFTSTLALSQNNQGTIVYEEKINIWKNLPPEMSGMKEQIPEFRSSKSVLIFNSEETLYKPKKRTKEEIEKQRERRAGQGRRGRRGRGGKGNKSITYSDLKEGTTTSSKEFFGKEFLITGKPKSYKWKLTGKQRQIGEYLCQEATYQDSTVQIKTWFTPMIPVMTGPNNYAGLPGMILHMDFDDGSRTITALDISLGEIDASLIAKPTEGKAVTEEDFEEIREEKLQEMEQEWGGKGRRVFRRG